MLKYLKDFLYGFLIGAMCYLPLTLVLIAFNKSLTAGFITVLAILFVILIGLIISIFVRGGHKDEDTN